MDAVVTAYDGVANVRRDYRLKNGKRYFKVYVSPGMEEEFLKITDHLTRVARIEDILKGGLDDDTPPG